MNIFWQNSHFTNFGQFWVLFLTLFQNYSIRFSWYLAWSWRSWRLRNDLGLLLTKILVWPIFRIKAKNSLLEVIKGTIQPKPLFCSYFLLLYCFVLFFLFSIEVWISKGFKLKRPRSPLIHLILLNMLYSWILWILDFLIHFVNTWVIDNTPTYLMTFDY